VGGLCRHLDWKIAVGALNSRACFRLVGGDVLSAPGTNKVDSHAQHLITKCRELQSARSRLNDLARVLMRCDHLASETAGTSMRHFQAKIQPHYGDSFLTGLQVTVSFEEEFALSVFATE
jgi:hypothetical protein